jgi:hypothetical protein
VWLAAHSVASVVVLVAAATSPAAATAGLVVYYCWKKGVGLFGGCLLVGYSMQFVVKSFVFGSYCSLQFFFECILNLVPRISPCVG